jgi:membrane-bound metal-dependent hydrolase YbcI (DUF457 family)
VALFLFYKKKVEKLLSKTHISFGICAGLLLLTSNYNFNSYELFPGLIIGSCFPDIDTEKSWAAQCVPFIDDKLRDIGVLKHRGITHSIYAVIMMVLLYMLIQNYFIMGFAIGYIGHILLDTLSHKFKITCKHDNKIYTIILII